jgi:molybdopterin converting factor small subunit
MATVTVRIPTPLRPLAGGASELQVTGATVGEALQQLEPALNERILSPEGEVRHFVNIYLGSRNVGAMDGLGTPVGEGDLISIIPAVTGGSARTLERRMAEVRVRIPEVSPREALDLQRAGAVLVDVRELEEIAEGTPAGALTLGRMLHYDALPARFTELQLERDPGCRYCADPANFPGYVDYEAFCTAAAA